MRRNLKTGKSHNPPAFPVTGVVTYPDKEGMTLRDYFAAAALTGMWACPTDLIDEAAGGDNKVIGHKQIAKLAYEQADAMLIERQKDEAL